MKTFIQRVVSSKIDLRYTRLIFRDPLKDGVLISFQPEVSYPSYHWMNKFFLKDIEQLEERVRFTLSKSSALKALNSSIQMKSIPPSAPIPLLTRSFSSNIPRKVSFYIKNSDICSVSLSPIVPSRGWIHESSLMNLYFDLNEAGMRKIAGVVDLIEAEETQDE